MGPSIGWAKTCHAGGGMSRLAARIRPEFDQTLPGLDRDAGAFTGFGAIYLKKPQAPLAVGLHPVDVAAHFLGLVAGIAQAFHRGFQLGLGLVDVGHQLGLALL